MTISPDAGQLADTSYTASIGLLVAVSIAELSEVKVRLRPQPYGVGCPQRAERHGRPDERDHACKALRPNPLQPRYSDATPTRVISKARLASENWFQNLRLRAHPGGLASLRPDQRGPWPAGPARIDGIAAKGQRHDRHVCKQPHGYLQNSLVFCLCMAYIMYRQGDRETGTWASER